jgi:hypothetical protein
MGWAVAGQGELISGLQLLNKGLNELCDSQSACIREVRGGLREPNERKSGSIQEPVHVSHSELLASPRPSQESQLNGYGDVGARRGGGRKKDPQTWFANLDASTAAAFFLLIILQKLDRHRRVCWASRRRRR